MLGEKLCGPPQNRPLSSQSQVTSRNTLVGMSAFEADHKSVGFRWHFAVRGGSIFLSSDSVLRRRAQTLPGLCATSIVTRDVEVDSPETLSYTSLLLCVVQSLANQTEFIPTSGPAKQWESEWWFFRPSVGLSSPGGRNDCST
jgi:hypothetical protein